VSIAPSSSRRPSMRCRPRTSAWKSIALRYSRLRHASDDPTWT
jgi:hypothetical protein